MISLHPGDCLQVMPQLKAESVDVAITSPPYNISAKYHTYDDNLPWDKYYEWLGEVGKELHRVLKPDGSFFLNIGFTPRQPWTAMRAAGVFGEIFTLQNQIIWVKSIVVNNKTMGHYQPLNSPRFLNNNWEFIFHFTKEGKRKLDALALSVPYVDENNKGRWESSTGKAPEGNVWFIKYETRNQQGETKHPAVFPIELPERCIKLHGITHNMVVLDPFVGTGATMLACTNLSNESATINGIGIELDPEYIKVAQSLLPTEFTVISTSP